MDIKIGCVSFDPNASNEKKIAELKKCPFQQECGFRILGYRISTNDSTQPKIRDREWGRTQTESTVDEAFAEFLNGRPADFDLVATEFLRRLNIVKDYFYNQDSLQFYASSLLLGWFHCLGLSISLDDFWSFRFE